MLARNKIKNERIFLLKNVVSSLTENINQLNTDQIIEIVYYSIYKHLKVHECSFDENLIKTSIQDLIHNKVNLVDTGKLLVPLAKIVRVIFIQPL